MNLLFIADPVEHFKIYKDTTFAMMREAQRRGHALAVSEPRHMHWQRGGRVVARVRDITLTGHAQDWFIAGEPREVALAEYDAVLMRKDPPFDSEYFYATHLLEQAEREGARVFNKPRALRDHPEKLAILEFPQFIGPTLVTRDAQDIRRFHAEHGDIILKPLDGMGGMGIFRVGPDGMNLGSIIETLNRDGSQSVMVQKFLPEITEGDKRVLVIGGKPVPYCLARIPQGTEVRGNLAAGGLGVARALSARDREIGEALGPLLQQRGLLLAGVDVIGDCITEINVTSPTCFQEIFDQTGCDVAALFVDALEAAVEACAHSACPLESRKLKVPCRAIRGTSSRSVSVSSATLGTSACDLASSCISQQNARSLSVRPTG
jgi:glutathione synthase